MCWKSAVLPLLYAALSSWTRLFFPKREFSVYRSLGKSKYFSIGHARSTLVCKQIDCILFTIVLLKCVWKLSPFLLFSVFPHELSSVVEQNAFHSVISKEKTFAEMSSDKLLWSLSKHLGHAPLCSTQAGGCFPKGNGMVSLHWDYPWLITCGWCIR